MHYENNKALLKHLDEMYSYIRNKSKIIVKCTGMANRSPLHLLNRQSMKLLLSGW
ncbi:hypothetical protein XCR1_2870005 [Xenorhabdus cabanillasii JM26]|uniref:Uncharacterized protein n=1 Tax=Xenorhabdus cabanillasii JM26 TaxID=1427517 RepID=W1J865_9GAMM|nr:hypothetical protein XCR1_2870005 [Xenorhabdus cabanillasii JM26]